MRVRWGLRMPDIPPNVCHTNSRSIEVDMATVTVSPKFQVVIPREARDSLHIRPGQKLQVMVYNGQLRFIPVRSLRELRGAYPGVGSKIERDADRV